MVLPHDLSLTLALSCLDLRYRVLAMALLRGPRPALTCPVPAALALLSVHPMSSLSGGES